jgi:hypothetical protein
VVDAPALRIDTYPERLPEPQYLSPFVDLTPAP